MQFKKKNLYCNLPGEKQLGYVTKLNVTVVCTHTRAGGEVPNVMYVQACLLHFLPVGAV